MAVEKPKGLQSQVSPSHLAKPSWKEDLLCARASPECYEETSPNVPSRGNCIPKGVTSHQIGLLDSSTTPPKASPLLSCLPRMERPACGNHGAALEHGGCDFFCCFLSQGFPSSPFFVPISCPWPHSMTPGNLSLHTMLPVYLEPGCREKRRFSGPQLGEQGVMGATKNASHECWSSLVRNGGCSHTHMHTGTHIHTHRKWLVCQKSL